MLYTVIETINTTSTPQTLVQILAPSSQRVYVRGLMIALQGSTPASAPINFDWVVQTSLGTGTPVTEVLVDRGQDDNKRATINTDYTVEPNLGTSFIGFSLHQQGTWPWQTPNREFDPMAKGNERIALRYLSATKVQVTITLYIEE